MSDGSNESEYHSNKRKALNELHREVRDRILIMSDKMKSRYDLRANSERFDEGQLVMLYNPQRKKGLSPKLQTHWEGPYKVIKKMNDLVYRIQWNGNTHRKMKVVHLERLTSCKIQN